MVQHQQQALSRDVQQCMKDCAECATICAQCAHHCLGMGGEHASPEHQALLQDCKQICGMAVGFMARSSQFANAICRQCAEICTTCGDACERLADPGNSGGGDQVMKQCSQICRRCAQSCERMAGSRV